MPYTDFTDVIQDDADAIRYLDGTTPSIVFTDMPNRILAINGLKFGPADEIASWIGKFLPYITGTEYLTDMSYMFYRSNIAGNPDFSNFNTTNATNMSHMFDEVGNSTLVLDLSNFDTSNVTDMSYMFYGCDAGTIDISGFDTSNVINMSHMFDEITAYGTLDFTNWDTSSVTDMSYMFDGMRYTEVNLDLSAFDTSSVTNMSRMFNTRNSSPASWTIDLSNWDTSSVTDMQGIFFQLSGKIWVPSTFVATSVIDADKKPFCFPTTGVLEVYTDATDAETQCWGTVAVSSYHIHYNSTYQDFINA